MKKTHTSIIALIVTAAVALVAYVYFLNHAAAPSVETTMITVDKSEYAFSFSYPSGPDGLEVVTAPENSIANLQDVMVLMPTKEAARFMSEPGNEAPASISVYVFTEKTEPVTTTEERPGRVTRLQNWVEGNQLLTAFNLAKGTPQVVEIDGLSAVTYKTDGLYQQQVYVASYKGNIYLFIGQYNDQSDAIYQQFQTLISSVTFN